MSGPWLSVIGIGEDGVSGLSAIARAAIDEAEILVGGARHLAMLPADARRRIIWASPIDATIKEIGTLVGKRVAVIASGDPMWFGIGATLRRTFDGVAMRIVPAPSAFSLAAARMGWALHEVECLTVHGRPLERISAFTQPGARLLVLSHDGTTPARAAAMLAAVGFGPSKQSEEHTPELQSHHDIVCRLLLEKIRTPTALGMFSFVFVPEWACQPIRILRHYMRRILIKHTTACARHGLAFSAHDKGARALTKFSYQIRQLTAPLSLTDC